MAISGAGFMLKSGAAIAPRFHAYSSSVAFRLNMSFADGFINRQSYLAKDDSMPCFH
jgi:hypothetical protein